MVSYSKPSAAETRIGRKDIEMMQKGSNFNVVTRPDRTAGRRVLLLLALAFILPMALTACASQVAVSATEPPAAQTSAPQPTKETPAAATEPPAATVEAQPGISDLNSFVAALENAGATVERGDPVQDSFFQTSGIFLKVNGQDVQVFEFADEAARQAAAATIMANGFIVGNAALDWIGQPYFFSTGRLIVLYVGKDAADDTLTLLQNTLGQPLTH
jgi:hypothetical protein